MSAAKVRWGLLATGAIARTFAGAVKQSETGVLQAVGSRSAESAAAFAAAYGIPQTHGSYDALLANPAVDAVYISTPHPMHAQWAVKAADAGKHLLVEKPIAVNRCEAKAIVDAAIRNDVFLMEAFMYRCHPQTSRLVELLRENAIGAVRVIQATFSFHAAFNRESRLWSNALAGGGILDVGTYTTSMSRLIAGAAAGCDFLNPTRVTGAARLHPETGVDAWATGNLEFETGAIAVVAAGIQVAQENVVRIFGSEGSMVLGNPWVAVREGEALGDIVLRRKGESPATIVVHAPVTSFVLEADVAGRAILAGKKQADAPAMTWNDTLGNLATLDAWRAAVGLVYDAEKTSPVSAHPA